MPKCIRITLSALNDKSSLMRSVFDGGLTCIAGFVQVIKIDDRELTRFDGIVNEFDILQNSPGSAHEQRRYQENASRLSQPVASGYYLSSGLACIMYEFAPVIR